jgi:MYXO-CTERM domain-containing protein
MARFHSLTIACALAAPTAWLLLGARDAGACGGCFHAPLEVSSTVVTDHRMAFSMSPMQTVLWDQIRYSGNPTEFAWVLPVRQGARIELSEDAWIAALDASTATVITGPSPTCSTPGGGNGCAFGGSSSAQSAGAIGGSGGGPSVQVVSQQVIGPYDAVTVRSTQGEALGDWLRANGFAVSTAIQPTIDAYTTEGFDFIALKLRPGYGVQAMQPVRVVTAGADPKLPLRMVAAGVGARVGIVLFVLSEGRYHPKNFSDAVIDFSQLAWDPSAQQSNYSTLADQALAAGGGTGWLTESSQPANVTPYASAASNPPLAGSYDSACRNQVVMPGACAVAGAADASGAAEGGSGDESGDDAAETGAVSDADLGESGAQGGGLATGGEAGGCMPTHACDDLQLAMSGITGPLWVTRLRADLPASALATDLVLEATSSQAPVSNLHQTDKYTVPGYSPCPQNGSCAAASAESPDRYADTTAFALGAVGLALAWRRRRSRP